MIRPGRQLENEALAGRCLLLDYRDLRSFLVTESEPGGGPASGEGGGGRARKYAGSAPMCLLYIAEDVCCPGPHLVLTDDIHTCRVLIAPPLRTMNRDRTDGIIGIIEPRNRAL
jgi:hypothetical protein